MPPVSYAEKLMFDASATIDLRFDCPVRGESAYYNRTDLHWMDEETTDSPEKENPANPGMSNT